MTEGRDEGSLPGEESGCPEEAGSGPLPLPERGTPPAAHAVCGESSSAGGSCTGAEPCAQPGDAPHVSPAVESVPAGKGAGGGGWFARHRLLSGLILGALAVSLLAGAFAAGFAVGRPSGGEGGVSSPGMRGRLPGERPSLPRAPRGERHDGAREGLEPLKGCAGELADFIAGELGISREDLFSEARKGVSVAEMAEEKGLSPDELCDAVAAKITELADRLASQGEIAEKRAQAVKSRASSLAKRVVYGSLLSSAPLPR